MTTETMRRVENVTLPMVSHGFRSGYATALVDGVRMRLHTSQHATTDYSEHVRRVHEEFARGEGEPVS